jgi:hypothetical protein
MVGHGFLVPGIAGSNPAAPVFAPEARNVGPDLYR